MRRAALVLATSVALLFSAVGVQAGTKVPVKMPSSKEVATGSGVPARQGDKLYIPGDGRTEYIQGEALDKSVPVPIIPRIDFSIPTTINAAKNLLKGGVQGMVLSAALQGMLDSVGAVIDDGGKVVKVSTATAQPVSSSDYVWKVPNVTNSFTTPAEACDYFRTTRTSYVSSEARFVSDAQFACWGTNSLGASIHYTDASRYGTTCPIDSVWDSASGSCQTNQGFMELASSDWDSMGQFADGQPADWLAGLLKDVCSSGPNPDSCFESMKASSALSGPATVVGSTSTKSVTGPTGTTTFNSQTKYNITYGDNFFNWSSTTTTTKTNPDGTTETTEETQDSNDEEQTPALGDPYKPIVDKYSEIEQGVSKEETVPAAIDYSPWYSFGGQCSEVTVELPIIGFWSTNYCPYIYDYVRPVLAFLLVMYTWHNCYSQWREALKSGRPV